VFESRYVNVYIAGHLYVNVYIHNRWMKMALLALPRRNPASIGGNDRRLTILTPVSDAVAMPECLVECQIRSLLGPLPRLQIRNSTFSYTRRFSQLS
jgi:hypothetical protein